MSKCVVSKCAAIKWKDVSKEEFDSVIANYPNKLLVQEFNNVVEYRDAGLDGAVFVSCIAKSIAGGADDCTYSIVENLFEVVSTMFENLAMMTYQLAGVTGDDSKDEMEDKINRAFTYEQRNQYFKCFSSYCHLKAIEEDKNV